MEGLQFDEQLDIEIPVVKASRSKPIKRKWREIEAIKDRQRLQKELIDMDIAFDIEELDY
ncbi:DUF3545 family protein [Vibrio astriarenae]|jgi:hypothetical protein|uniref:DUF3545 family protein n=1 Tax=Vibrio agarivorans TaxID=153622 RepID=A0ABT7XX36_9VIBR|nr:DUF3545 family protein [Vibrio agarivorans]MDN2480343.1 DUF3545 family protein [Vibrio agarivorans]